MVRCIHKHNTVPGRSGASTGVKAASCSWERAVGTADGGLAWLSSFTCSAISVSLQLPRSIVQSAPNSTWSPITCAAPRLPTSAKKSALAAAVGSSGWVRHCTVVSYDVFRLWLLYRRAGVARNETEAVLLNGGPVEQQLESQLCASEPCLPDTSARLDNDMVPDAAIHQHHIVVDRGGRDELSGYHDKQLLTERHPAQSHLQPHTRARVAL